MTYYEKVGKVFTLFQLSALQYLKQPNKTTEQEYAFSRIIRNDVVLQHIKDLKKNLNIHENYLNAINSMLNIFGKEIYESPPNILSNIYYPQPDNTPENIPESSINQKLCDELEKIKHRSINSISWFLTNNLCTREFYIYWCSCGSGVFYIMLMDIKNRYYNNRWLNDKLLYIFEEKNNKLIKRYLTLEEVIIIGYSSINYKFENIFDYIPDELITKEICILILSFDNTLMDYLIINSFLLDIDICLSVAKRNPLAIRNMPYKYRTHEICKIAVMYDPVLYHYVPTGLRDELQQYIAPYMQLQESLKKYNITV